MLTSSEWSLTERLFEILLKGFEAWGYNWRVFFLNASVFSRFSWLLNITKHCSIDVFKPNLLRKNNETNEKNFVRFLSAKMWFFAWVEGRYTGLWLARFAPRHIKKKPVKALIKILGSRIRFRFSFWHQNRSISRFDAKMKSKVFQIFLFWRQIRNLTKFRRNFRTFSDVSRNRKKWLR